MTDFDKGALPTQDGQIVEVVYRAPVHHIGPAGFCLGDKYEYVLIDPHVDHVISVEVKPDPPKSWQDNDAVRDSLGGVWVRNGSGRWSLANGVSWLADAVMERDISTGNVTVLVRGGEVVAVPSGSGG